MIPSAEQRAAVVVPLRLAREDRVRDHPQARGVDELCELVAGALAVDDDAGEPAEQTPPEVALARGAARKDVVRREHERCVDAEEPVVQLRRGEPLEMDDVGLAPPEAGEPDRVLQQLHGDAQPRSPEDPGADRVEELGAPIAVRLGRIAEAERRRHELHLGASRVREPTRARGRTAA